MKIVGGIVMEELKRRILQDGLIIDNRILKVDNFLNQQIDANLIINIGKEFARIFLTALSTASSRLNHQVLPSALSQQLLWAIFPSSLHARNALSSCEMPSMHQKCTPTQRRNLYGKHQQNLSPRRRKRTHRR